MASEETRTSNGRLIPVVRWNELHPWPSLAGLRWRIINAKKNGFDRVVRRIGRRVLIDEAEFFAWAALQKNDHTVG
ncbi:MAG TPA: hypothetical protein VF678_08105 [bacterium]